MHLQPHYDQLFAQSSRHIREHNVTVDAWLDEPSDDRRGITLLLRPAQAIKDQIQIHLDRLKQIEPDQYYYPISDIHLTILSIISCYPGFALGDIEPMAYQEVIASCLRDIPVVKLHFRGVTLAPGAVMVQGFVEDNVLNQLRDRLRLAFAQSSLQQTLDKRYRLETAHSTVVRFRQALIQPEVFLRGVEDLRKIDFGTCEVDTLELVYNDWYQRAEVVQPLARFFLT